jgi:hypothetical protein
LHISLKHKSKRNSRQQKKEKLRTYVSPRDQRELSKQVRKTGSFRGEKLAHRPQEDYGQT